MKNGKPGASSGRDITTDGALGELCDPMSKDPREKIVNTACDTIPKAKAGRKQRLRTSKAKDIELK